MNSWIANALTSQRTTWGGLMLAVGTAIMGAEQVGVVPPDWLKLFGLILAAGGPVILGTQARQGNVSTEAVRRAERGFASLWTTLGVVAFTFAVCACFSGCMSLTPYGPGALSSNNVKVVESTAHAEGVDTFALEIKSRGDAAAKTSVKYTGEAESDETHWAFAVLGEANVESAERVKPLNEGAGAALAALPQTLAPLVEVLGAVGDAPEGTPGASIRDRIMQMIMDRIIGAVAGGVRP